MSEEKVELARQYFERLNAEGPHGARHMRHPDIEVIDPPNFPDADRWVGEAAVWERVEGFVELGWDGLFRVEEYLDAGEEVVVVWRAMGRSAHGGVFLWTRRWCTCSCSRTARSAESGST